MRRASVENSPFASEIFIISIRSILSPSSYYHPSFHCFPLFLIPLSYYPTKHYFPLLTPFISGLCEKVSSRRWRLCRNRPRRKKQNLQMSTPPHFHSLNNDIVYIFLRCYNPSPVERNFTRKKIKKRNFYKIQIQDFPLLSNKLFVINILVPLSIISHVPSQSSN